MGTEMGEQLLLDAPSLVYRAFFALPTTVTDDRGNSVNAVRGFMDMAGYLIVKRRPRSLIAAFDADWRPRLRVDAYRGYKATRAEDPPELPPQFEVLAEVLDAAGLPRAEAAGLEADDVLATLVAEAQPSDRFAIVTGDRDLLALVKDPQVKVVWPVKGVSSVQEYDASAVEEKYGVPPELYASFATLRGDASDGLPGVAGIGPVRAAKLLNEYGSIDSILADLDALPSAQASAFKDAGDYLAAVKTVVTLVSDAAIEMTPARPPDEGRLRALGEEHSLGSSVTRLLRALESGHLSTS